MGAASLIASLCVRIDHLSAGRSWRCFVNWPPFRPDTRHNLEGLRLSSSTGLCLTTTNVSN